MEDLLATIQDAYIDYTLTQGHAPSSVYLLCKHISVDEASFYEHFASLEALEQTIWLNFFEITVKKITTDEVYEGYSVREKILAFYYTWLEQLKNNRSYVMHTLGDWHFLDFTPTALDALATGFQTYAQELMREARESQEIVSRPFLENAYPNLLWGQAKSVLRFWVNDTSPNFEKTDLYVEKNVNFAFDGLGHTPLESAFDYFKFLFQNG